MTQTPKPSLTSREPKHLSTRTLGTRTLARFARVTVSAVTLWLGAALFATPTFAATAYISDKLTVPVRSGPTNRHRIVHSGLPAGTRMETLGVDEAAGYTQIRTARGTEGWILTRYLQNQPAAKELLANATAARTKAQKELATAQAKIRELSSQTQQQSSANEQGQSQIEKLRTELGELQRVSSSAVETHERMLSLDEENVRLRDELDDMAEARARLEDNSFTDNMMLGGGLMFAGLIAGVLIKARPHRSAWS